MIVTVGKESGFCPKSRMDGGHYRKLKNLNVVTRQIGQNSPQNEKFIKTVASVICNPELSNEARDEFRHNQSKLDSIYKDQFLRSNQTAEGFVPKNVQKYMTKVIKLAEKYM